MSATCSIAPLTHRNDLPGRTTAAMSSRGVVAPTRAAILRRSGNGINARRSRVVVVYAGKKSAPEPAPAPEAPVEAPEQAMMAPMAPGTYPPGYLPMPPTPGE